VTTQPAELPPRVRWVGLVVMLLVTAGVTVSMLLSSDGVRALRRASEPISATVRWFENAAPAMNLAHVVAFGLVTLLLKWAFPRLTLPQVVMWSFAFAVVTELLQFFSPGRVPRLTDLLNDMLGIAVATAILALLAWLVRALGPRGALRPSG
jgi:VanZ family protein